MENIRDRRKQDNSEYNLETVKAGVREDAELYRWVVAAYERSKKYLETLHVFENAEKFAKIYDDGVWATMDTGGRPGHLSKVSLDLAFVRS